MPTLSRVGTRRRGVSRSNFTVPGFNPVEAALAKAGVPLHRSDLVTEVPDPIEFVVSDKYLNRPNLYPRQATFQKLIFLRKDMLTEFDYEVIGEWEEKFRQTGNEGLNPGIMDRIDINSRCPTCGHDVSNHHDRKDQCTIGDCLCRQYRGRHWFRETQAVIGRRGSKGFIGGLAGSYVTWTYMHRPGGPQEYYGIDRDKRLTGIVFAGKKEQARDNLWRDWFHVITGAPCFGPFISRPQAERLTIKTPIDLINDQERRIEMDNDTASIEIIPAPSTVMAARGPATFCLDPTTPVLTADLRWVQIQSLQAGDEVVGVDEYAQPGKQRKMRAAQVIATQRVNRPAMKITFEDETSVVCSYDHRWLCHEMGTGGGSKWREAQGLVPGNKIKALVDPWQQDDSAEGGYLRGFFDGEGCVSGWSQRGSHSVYFSQNDGPVLQHVKSLMADRGYDLMKNTDQSPSCEQWKLADAPQAMRFLGSVRPIRLMPKARRVWEGVAPRGGLTRGGRVRPNSYKVIASIEKIPSQDLVDIQTTTKTFIANGLISHNCEMFDEQAHVISSNSAADAEAVYDAATPALDQFGVDGFIYAPSSPWRKTGKFYENWQLSIEMDRDEHGAEVPAYPERLMLQLPSWGIYENWDEAGRIPWRPPVLKTETVVQQVKRRKTIDGKKRTVIEKVEVDRRVPDPDHPIQYLKALKGAIQTYDDQMKRLERANPETFKVERKSHWAESVDAYLNSAMVDRAFAEWNGNKSRVSARGVLRETYMAHGDPATSNKRFGWALGHRVWVPSYDNEGNPTGEGWFHAQIDVVRCWEPADYPDHILDYDDVLADIEDDVKVFLPEDVSFDQFNVPSTIGTLRKWIRKQSLPKAVHVHEVTRTRPLNWKHFELFKSAINMGLVHIPLYALDGDLNYASDQGQLELKFLEEKNGVVNHPDTGPVQSKDIADAIVETTVALIGKQMATFLGMELDGLGLIASAPQGTDPYRHQKSPQERLAESMGGSAAAQAAGRGMAARGRGPARGGMRRR